MKPTMKFDNIQNKNNPLNSVVEPAPTLERSIFKSTKEKGARGRKVTSLLSISS